MANNTKNTKSSSSKRRNGSKSTAPRKTAKQLREEQEQKANDRKRIITIVIFAVSLLFFFIAIIKGEGAWYAVHNFYVGLFGILAACLLPILVIIASLLYNGKNGSNKNFAANLIEGLVLVFLVAAFIHIVANQPGGSFSQIIKEAYSAAPTSFNGGYFGAMLGWALLTFGKAPAIIVDAVLALVDIMLLARITVMQLLKGAAKPAVATYDKVDAIVEERRNAKQKDIQIQVDDEPAIDEEAKKQQQEKKKNEKKKKTPIDPEIDAADKFIAEFNNRTGTGSDDNAEAKDDVKIIDNQGKKGKKGKQNEQENAESQGEDNGDEKDDTPFVVTDEQMQSAVSEYKLPDVNLLNEVKHASEKDVGTELQLNADKLIETLKSFNIDATVTDISRGPTVTRYELMPAPGVKISKITNLADDIALRLAARQVRIAPVPGKSAIGVEVPNMSKSSVSIREMIDTPAFKKQKSKLSAGLGMDITGQPVYCDIANMPHLLIAGTTGSGKSVCLNSIIVSILYRARPDEVKFVMIDPKQVEFSKYAGIPHLLVPVVTNPKKAAGALSWAVNEMLERYGKFYETGVKDIEGYNNYVKKHDELEPMPKICIFIDELADLMMAAPKDVEDSICRLAQMARAAGMHLVIATQRPSVDVITGLVKANISSRIALTVSSAIDSRTILDTGGAEKLLGRGDMLYSPIDADKPYRVQGCYVSDEEIEKVCDFIKSQGETDYNEDIQKEIDKKATEQDKDSGKFSNVESGPLYDVLFQDAAEAVIDMGKASTSSLQRKFSIGYSRAAKIMDQLEEYGVIGAADGSKPRTILMTKSMLLEKLAYDNGEGPEPGSTDEQPANPGDEDDDDTPEGWNSN